MENAQNYDYYKCLVLFLFAPGNLFAIFKNYYFAISLGTRIFERNDILVNYQQKLL